MYQSNPQVLSVLVADRLQQVQADLQRGRDLRRARQRRRQQVKERRWP